MLIGVTGQTGSGKTTLCESLEKVGFTVIYADLSARAVVEPGKLCLKILSDIFGMGIITENGELNRRQLGEIVFNNSEKLQILNDTMYPFITEHIFNIIAQYPANKPIFLDAPTLFESKIDVRCDLIIGIIANSKQEQIDRLMLRDRITSEQVLARISSQQTQEFFMENCDIIVNNRNLDKIINRIREIYNV